MLNNVTNKLAMMLSLLAIVFIFCILGCNNAKNEKDILRWSLLAGVADIDPHRASNMVETQIVMQLFEGLCTKDMHGDVVPGVAEKWEISDEGRKYIFHLRKGVKWSNGKNLTARDFEITWKETLNPQYAENAMVDVLYYIKNAKAYSGGKVGSETVGVKAIDESTLEVILETPVPYFLDLLAADAKYLPQYTEEGMVKNNRNVSEGFICNGPFVLQSFVPNERLIMYKNENYYNKDAVKLRKIECSFIDDSSTNLLLFNDERIDMSDVACPASEVEVMRKLGSLKKSPVVYSVFIIINMEDSLLKNKNIRMALAYAIDRKKIADLLGEEIYEPAFAFVPYGFKNDKSGMDFRMEGGNLFGENISEAVRLLSDAGYADAANLPEIEILYNNSSSHRMVAEIIQEMWLKNLGVRAKLVNQEMKVYEQSIEQSEFMCARVSWFREYADPLTYLNILRSDNKNNRMHYKNAEYDRLINKALNAVSGTEHWEALHEAEKMLIAEMAVIPLYFVCDTYLESSAVHGVIRDGTGGVWLREAYKTLKY